MTTTRNEEDRTHLVEAAAIAECAHHWILGAPSRETTSGVCRNCGAERSFMDAYRAPAPRKGRTTTSS